MNRAHLSAAAAAALWALHPVPGAAIEPSGTTVAVVPSAAAAGQAGRRILKVQGPVFMGDVVQTGGVGEAQIEFRDETRLVVGANSRLTIDSFVFNDNNTAEKITMNAVKGASRFITGASRKQAYAINTPTSTIGIRGTRFDLFVAGNGETSFALYEGGARLCSRSTGRCMEVRGSCAVVVVPPVGDVTPVRDIQAKVDRLRALFPYAVSQARLRPDFRVNTSNCQLATQAPPRGTSSAPGQRASLQPPDPQNPGSPTEPPGGGPGPGSPPSEPPSGRPNNPGNDKAVGNAGNKFGGDGTRGNSAAGRGDQDSAAGGREKGRGKGRNK